MAIGRREVFALYRQLLRLHQKLPSDMEYIGRQFIREEFKRHKNSSEEHAKMFMKEWSVSLNVLGIHLPLTHVHMICSLPTYVMC